MNRMLRAGCLGVALAAAGAGQNLIGELSQTLSDIEKKAVALAELVPADQYTYRPSEEARTFKAAAQHLANGNRLLLRMTRSPMTEAQFVEMVKANAALEQSATKSEVVKALKGSFAEVKKALAETNTEGMEKKVPFFGTEKSVAGMYVTIAAHASEHLGQLIAYVRGMGMAPPWSQGKE
jgi:uncharacterized damage-inducible protein DinB